MKKLVVKQAVVCLLLVGFVLALTGCEITYEIKSEDTLLINLEMDEDEIEYYTDLDDEDLESEKKLKKAIEEEMEDEYDDDIYEMKVDSVNIDKNDYTITYSMKCVGDDLEDMFYEGFIMGDAKDIMHMIAEEEYDGDYDDFVEEFAEDVEDEYWYAYDGSGDKLDEDDVEKYLKKNLSGKSLFYMEDGGYMYGETMDIYTKGKVEMVLYEYEDIKIKDDRIKADGTVFIIYRGGGGSSFWSTLIVILFIAIILLLLINVINKNKHRIQQKANMATKTICPNCGAANKKGASFCIKCGNRMDD